MSTLEQKTKTVQDFLWERTRIFRHQYPHWAELELTLILLDFPEVEDHLKARTKQMKENNNAITRRS